MAEIQTRAVTVAYSDIGEGRPLLLLHATLHDRRDFDPVLDALARTYRVIALDWPGHGESTAPEDQELTSVLLAECLEDLVDALGLDSVTCIGNSVGGFAAARLAITRPDLVRALVLVNTAGFTPTHLLARAGCALMGRPTAFRRIYPTFLRLYLQASSASDREIAGRALDRARSEAGLRTATSLWRSFASPENDLRRRATRIQAPTLIVWGTRDRTFPLSWGRATRRAIPGSQLATLPVGHVAFSSAPDEFLELVGPFLAEH